MVIITVITKNKIQNDFRPLSQNAHPILHHKAKNSDEITTPDKKFHSIVETNEQNWPQRENTGTKKIEKKSQRGTTRIPTSKPHRERKLESKWRRLQQRETSPAQNDRLFWTAREAPREELWRPVNHGGDCERAYTRAGAPPCRRLFRFPRGTARCHTWEHPARGTNHVWSQVWAQTMRPSPHLYY